ncbi:hypothetical protein EX30DRAFT_398743 [Ascodesmis nigricans]|uniref:CBM1 domain-containing protein n=1 Tax=Ascodesmis nigricans TaxID=341454 RepID=A0A4S2MJJ6_9PEZI|nr:hypothetical protein EX30DRAFT_398743 [Ascodesmis nigricans]
MRPFHYFLRLFPLWVVISIALLSSAFVAALGDEHAVSSITSISDSDSGFDSEPKLDTSTRSPNLHRNTRNKSRRKCNAHSTIISSNSVVSTSSSQSSGLTIIAPPSSFEFSSYGDSITSTSTSPSTSISTTTTTRTAKCPNPIITTIRPMKYVTHTVTVTHLETRFLSVHVCASSSRVSSSTTTTTTTSSSCNDDGTRSQTRSTTKPISSLVVATSKCATPTYCQTAMKDCGSTTVMNTVCLSNPCCTQTRTRTNMLSTKSASCTPPVVPMMTPECPEPSSISTSSSYIGSSSTRSASAFASDSRISTTSCSSSASASTASSIITTSTSTSTTTTASSPSSTATCTHTVCYDYVNECGQMYGGCVLAPHCGGPVKPTFSRPACSTTMTRMGAMTRMG